VALDFDSAESASAVPLFFNATFVNNEPVFSASLPGLSGALEDTPFVVTHQMLLNGLPGSDLETGLLDYQITELGEGTLKRGNVTLTFADLPQVLRPGESVLWIPPLNRHNANNPAGAGPTTAFKVRLRDDLGLVSSTQQDVKVNVASVNDTPVFGTVSKLSGTSKYNGVNLSTRKSILYSEIQTQLPVSDADGNTITYRIESLGAGTLELIGAGGAVGVANLMLTQEPIIASSSGATPNISNEYRWTPPLNGTGEYLVMKVRAHDGTEYSASTVDVRIDVTGINAKPTVAKNDFTLGMEAGTTGTKQGAPMVITYDTLLAQSGAADTDFTPLSFKITELSSGSVVFGSRTVTTAGALVPDLTVGPGEWLTWAPATNVSGTQVAFKMKAFDNMDLQDDPSVTVRVKIDPVNQAPTLNALGSFTALRNTDKTFTVSDLIAAVNAQDLEDGNSSTLLKFRVDQVLSGGTLRLRPQGGSATVVEGSSTVFSSGELIWTPPSNMIGTYDAFIVSALDKDNLPSATNARIRIVVSGTNARPVLNSDNSLATPSTDTVEVTLPSVASENTPFSISYDDLKTALKVDDTDSSWVTFVLKSVSNGIFKKSASALIPSPSAGVLAPPANSVVAPTETVLFYPESSASNASYEIMQVYAYDGSSYSAKLGVVKLVINRVNQAPTLFPSYQFAGTINPAN
jgi:hypothetical protein